MGSQITFLWGPPGTGKTFSIAALVASLLIKGESVLVTSHTHAAVEQALYALVRAPESKAAAGFLHGSEIVKSGQVLKLGPLRDAKVPRECHFQSSLEDRQEEDVKQLQRCRAEIERLSLIVVGLRKELDEWTALDDAGTQYDGAKNATAKWQDRCVAAEAKLANLETSFEAAVAKLEKARKALLRRSRKVQRAQTS